MENDFTARGAADHPSLLTITKLGGTFRSSANGVGDQEDGYSTQASIAGFTKSIAKEWPNVSCKVVDFSADATNAEIGHGISEELSAPEQRVEIGRLKQKRFGLDVAYAPLGLADETSSPSLDSQSVILITGGGRGITAEIAASLAMAYKPTLILVGRAEQPTADEDKSTEGLTTPRDLKAKIMDQLRASERELSIAAVEQIYQKLLRDREIRENIARFKSLGAKVAYKSIDVRDQLAFSELIQDIYKEYGRIDGVVHGAGIIEDGFVKHKSVESFNRVYGTKVQSALTLSKALRLKELKFLFLLSSVVGRTGNAGQTDYVAANEVLNKLAIELDGKTSARVASLMWGPWKGGMANAELESIFARYGWAMIAAEDGRRTFLEELQKGKKGEVEVLLVAELVKQHGAPLAKGVLLHEAEPKVSGTNSFEFHLTLNPATDLYLQDHTFDNVPVMPMAFALELMAEAVSSAYADWHIERVHNLDIPSGIVFDTSSKPAIVEVVEHSRSEAALQVTASLSTFVPRRRTNFKATFELSQNGRSDSGSQISNNCYSQIPSLVPATTDWETMKKFDEPLETLPSIEQVYGNWLFHGPLFQHIASIDAIGTDGITGQLSASQPEKCRKEPGKANWAIDPVLLDSAMQLAGIWARQFLDITALPTGFRKLHLFPERVGGNFYARVFMDPVTTAKDLTCNIAVYSKEGKLAFLLEGLGGVGSKSLNRLAAQAASSGTTR